MKFLTFTILLVAVSRAAGAKLCKRGVASTNSAYAAPASVAYTKLQQPVQKQVVAQAPQQYYAQAPQQYYAQAAPAKYAAAPAAYAVPVQQQLQYEPQAYAQPQPVKYAAAPAPAPAAYGKQVALRPQFSLANDVSSFAYSSPFVTYNNLGLLSQVVGKIAGGQVQAKAAPAAAVYQQPLQKLTLQQNQVAYAPAPVQAKIPAAQPVQTKYVAPSPQQYLTQVPQFAQQYIAAAPQAQGYTAQTQSYSAQAVQQAPQQTYAAQSIPQAVYSSAPQLFTNQQLKQANFGVDYAQ